jgi:hypothetical protein
MNELFELGLRIAAVGQLAIACLNLRLVRVMHWEREVASMPLLIREVFHVHAWFISLTLGIFATTTWRFASAFASGTVPIAQWLACSIGLFWAVRAVMQVTYYTSSHWRGIRTRTVVHGVLLVAYSALALLYLGAALRPLVVP